MLSVKNLRKVYRSKKAEEVVALDNVSIDFPETGFVFLLGKSGSGKSTLLNAIGGLDKFDGGEIIIKGKSSADFSQADFDSYRNTFIGFIFQEYNILENFSVAKNLALALELQGKKADHEEVMKLLTQVEMDKYAKRKPNELSGGQKQRVAIARALIKNPEIIMADEPTGALDSNTGKQVMDTLKELSKTKLVIVVSHDREFAEIYGDRIIELKDGKILHDITKKEVVAEETKSGIKIIDNDIVYIKKGQEITANEMKAIAEIINNKSKDADAFISFNKDANDKLKEGAKINDSGNKEKFVKTEKEDIKVKQYNPNSLKLIKSRLKFSDSLKMGASALKNKVGKLIFTIILSFLAFTIFGIFDALSQWNRAESVYEAMQINQSKTVVLRKRSWRPDWKEYDDDTTTNADLKMLNEKFTDRTVKGVVGSESNVSYLRFGTDHMNQFSIEYSRDPLYSTDLSGFVNFTPADIAAYGFEVCKGRLPENANEIAISKYTMEALIKLTEKETEENKKITEANIVDADETDGVDKSFYTQMNGFGTNNSSEFVKIVGVIDDKTDYQKYKDIDSDKRLEKSYSYEPFFESSFLRIAYVNKDRFEDLEEKGTDAWMNIGTENSSHGLSKSSLFSLESKYQNQDQTEYHCFIGTQKYILDLYSDNSWNISYSSPEYVWGETLYSYNTTSGIYDNTNYRQLNETETEEFFNGTGLGIFGADANNDKIPDKFEKGLYSRAEIASKYITYYKNNESLIGSDGKFIDIGDNNVIISSSMANSFLGVDYEEKINNGTTLLLEKEGRDIATLTVVGVSSDSSDVYFSDKTLTEKILAQFRGYEMVVTALTGNEAADEAFIKFCENGENDARWAVQNSATNLLNQFESFIVSVAKVFLYIAIGFAVFAALMLMNFISTSISYKKREIGVLRALGARGSDVFGIFFNESLIIALINFVLATIATIVTCTVVNSILVTKLGIDIVLLVAGIRQVILILGVSILAAFIGSFLPTFKVSRKRPIDAINNR